MKDNLLLVVYTTNVADMNSGGTSACFAVNRCFFCRFKLIAYFLPISILILTLDHLNLF